MENQKQCGHNESFLVGHLLYNDRFTCLPRVGYFLLKTATDRSHEATACWGSKSRKCVKCLDVQRTVWVAEETGSITENSVKDDETDGGGVATGYNTTLWQSRKRGARQASNPHPSVFRAGCPRRCIGGAKTESATGVVSRCLLLTVRQSKHQGVDSRSAPPGGWLHTFACVHTLHLLDLIVSDTSSINGRVCFGHLFCLCARSPCCERR